MIVRSASGSLPTVAFPNRKRRPLQPQFPLKSRVDYQTFFFSSERLIFLISQVYSWLQYWQKWTFPVKQPLAAISGRYRRRLLNRCVSDSHSDWFSGTLHMVEIPQPAANNRFSRDHAASYHTLSTTVVWVGTGTVLCLCLLAHGHPVCLKAIYYYV